MIASRLGLTTVARTALVQHQRRGFYSVTPGLPQLRVTLGEKICHGIAIICGLLAYPAWVVSHMREYKKGRQLTEGDCLHRFQHGIDATWMYN